MYNCNYCAKCTDYLLHLTFRHERRRDERKHANYRILARYRHSARSSTCHHQPAPSLLLSGQVTAAMLQYLYTRCLCCAKINMNCSFEVRTCNNLEINSIGFDLSMCNKFSHWGQKTTFFLRPIVCCLCHVFSCIHHEAFQRSRNWPPLSRNAAICKVHKYPSSIIKLAQLAESA